MALAIASDMSNPKRTAFEIATVGQGRETRTGYVLGGFATHKEPGPGAYFWTFTHIETGTSINVYPCHDNKASALAHLAKLADGSAPQLLGPAGLLATLDRYGRAWGLGQ